MARPSIPMGSGYKVVVFDYGVNTTKRCLLEQRGCQALVVPAQTSARERSDWRPDGLLLSNGPGDPAADPGIVQTIQNLLGLLPIFGICLGIQILGLAMGGKTYKLKFGHRGGQPAGQESKDRPGRNHLPESRICR